MRAGSKKGIGPKNPDPQGLGWCGPGVYVCMLRNTRCVASKPRQSRPSAGILDASRRPGNRRYRHHLRTAGTNIRPHCNFHIG